MKSGSRSDLVGLVAFALCGLASCVEPGQYGGPIPVDQSGLEGRLETACTITQQSMCGLLATDDEEGDAGRADTSGRADASLPEGGRRSD